MKVLIFRHGLGGNETKEDRGQPVPAVSIGPRIGCGNLPRLRVFNEAKNQVDENGKGELQCRIEQLDETGHDEWSTDHRQDRFTDPIGLLLGLDMIIIMVLAGTCRKRRRRRRRSRGIVPAALKVGNNGGSVINVGQGDEIFLLQSSFVFGQISRSTKEGTHP